MYEFDSVSVSTFAAAELAATLTAKSSDGWDVVAIVPAGSEIVAYLRKASAQHTVNGESTSASASSDTTTTEPSTSKAAADLLASESQTSGASEPVASTPSSDTASSGWGASSASQSGSNWGSDSAGSWGGSSQQAAAAPPAQPTPSVPAGWYADPAGRFELRYWDGGAWTEHVSRAGQQYTDPPVA